MAFPESARVHYKNNPLIGVVLQLRFPAVLRIDAEIPSEFQHRIRSLYPYFEQAPGANVLPTQQGEALQQLNFQFNLGSKAYNFISADKIWKVSLTRGSLAIITSEYKQGKISKTISMSHLKHLSKYMSLLNLVGLVYVIKL